MTKATRQSRVPRERPPRTAQSKSHFCFARRCFADRYAPRRTHDFTRGTRRYGCGSHCDLFYACLERMDRVPALLASVISYSVFVSVFGEATLFTHAPHFPFVPGHLPLYALLALFCTLVAIGFLKVMRGVRDLVAKLPGSEWVRPGIGGLALGLFAVSILLLLDQWGVVEGGQGVGILGGGYGAAQVAISGAAWLPTGWSSVEQLLLLTILKYLPHH